MGGFCVGNPDGLRLPHVGEGDQATMEDWQESQAASAGGLSTLSAARSIVYGILARVFDSEKDEDLIKLSESSDVQIAFETLCGMEGVDFLKCLSSLQESDFAALFIGPGPALAPPYESSYLSKGGLPMGETTFRVRKAYRALGCKVAKKNSVPDDHISTELAFMAKASFDDAAIPEQASFLTEHLEKWAFSFSEKVTKARPESGYALAAKVMADFVGFDAQLVRGMKKRQEAAKKGTESKERAD